MAKVIEIEYEGIPFFIYSYGAEGVVLKYKNAADVSIKLSHIQRLGNTSMAITQKQFNSKALYQGMRIFMLDLKKYVVGFDTRLHGPSFGCYTFKSEIDDYIAAKQSARTSKTTLKAQIAEMKADLLKLRDNNSYRSIEELINKWRCE